jgi:hypothetical protein
MVSVGASVYPDDGADADELVYLSDQRMYEDKMRAKKRMVAKHATPVPPAKPPGLATPTPEPTGRTA